MPQSAAVMEIELVGTHVILSHFPMEMDNDVTLFPFLHHLFR